VSQRPKIKLLDNRFFKYEVDFDNLPHGSLLLMGAGIQEYWQHKLSKTSLQVGPRINLTLRYMT
jgi:hypothetical protein